MHAYAIIRIPSLTKQDHGIQIQVCVFVFAFLDMEKHSSLFSSTCVYGRYIHTELGKMGVPKKLFF